MYIRKWSKLALSWIMLWSVLATWISATVNAAEVDDQYEVLRRAGIFTGFADGTSRLTEDMTREQFAAILARLWKLDTTGGFKGNYTDVRADRWSVGAIEAVTRVGLMNGVREGVFEPAQKVTYEQLAAVLVRAYGESGISQVSVGGTMSGWARKAVTEAVAGGLLPAQSDYTRNAPRGTLVQCAYAVYTPVYVTDYSPVSDRRIEVKFSDGGSDQFNLAQPLSSQTTTPVRIKYGNRPYIVEAIWDPNKQLNQGANGTGQSGGTDGDGIPGTSEDPYIDPDNEMELSKLESLSNKKLKLTLKQPVVTVRGAYLSIKDPQGGELEIKQTQLSGDGMTIIMTTEEQTAYREYTLFVNDQSEIFTAPPADTTSPIVTGVTVNPNATVSVVFSKPLDPDSGVGDTASYYIGGLTVLNAEQSDDGMTVTLRTSKQTENTAYTLIVDKVADWSGNKIVPRGNIRFIGVVDKIKPELLSAVGFEDNTVELEFSEPLDPDTVKAISNYSVDQGLKIQRAELLKDKATVRLTTSKQTFGKFYKLSVKNVADLSGNVMKDTDVHFFGNEDLDAPILAEEEVLDNGQIKLIFDEKVRRIDAEKIANYRISPDLAVLKAKLSADQTTVTLTTSRHNPSLIYTLTVANIADLAGNVMDKTEFSFLGTADITPPEVVSIFGGTNQVEITFNKRLDKASAENSKNYSFDNELNIPLSAVYNDAAKKVTLRTAQQTAGATYRITIDGVKDTSGNAIKQLQQAFIGAYNGYVKAVSASAVSINMIDLIFDQPLTDAELAVLHADIVSINQYPATSYGYYATFIPQQDKKKARFSFRTAREAMPTIFQQGYAYEIKVTGPASLATKDGANIVRFVGTSVTQAAPPTISNIKPDKNATIVVTFSEPVKNVYPGAFAVIDYEGNPVAVTGDTLGDPNAIVSEVKLYLGSDLVRGKIYKLAVYPGITDASGYVGLKLKDEFVKNGYMPFAGTDSVIEAPSILTVGSYDKYNFDIYFSEAVIGGEIGPYTLLNVTDKTTIPLHSGEAVFTLSPSGNRVSVHLQQSSGYTLDSGKTYKLIYDVKNGAITNTRGKAFTQASGKNEFSFTGKGNANSLPYIKEVSASGEVVTVTWSEDVLYSGQSDAFNLIVDGKTIAVYGGYVSGRTMTLNVPSLPPGRSGEISVSGSGAIRDINGQSPDSSRIFRFAVR